MADGLVLAFVRFEKPAYLLLLLLVPVLIALSYRSLAGLGPARRVVALIARCVVLALMALALAGMQRVKSNDNLSVIFLIDRSSSVPRELQERAFELVKQSQAGARPADRIGLIAFDGRSAIEQLPAPEVKVKGIADPLAPDQTDMASAVRLALAMFTSDTMRRLVVLSDGNENVGKVMDEVKQVASTGVPIDVIPLIYEHEREVVFEQLRAPPTAAVDETINLRMVLRSNAPQPVRGRINLYHNGRLVPLGPLGAGYPVELNPGPNALKIPVPLRVAGAHRFRAVFEPADTSADVISANNEGRAFTVVSGQGMVLIVTTERNWESSEILRAALKREKLESEIELAGEQPLTQDRLITYSLVILDNVPANLLVEDEQESLALYVRELGGGLMMIGGDDSFGAGGWMGSPVEEVMPVSFDVKSKKQIPKGALVLVMHACEIPQGNYIGERVAIAAVKTLSTRDLVGVLAWDWVGGENRNWTVPLQSVGNKSAVIQRIKKMSMGDLPDLYAVMKQGVDSLIERKDAAARHMIVVSDFDPAFDLSPAGSGTKLLAKMRQNNISCSTVSIGWGGHPIDVQKAAAIARGAATGGKHYPCHNFSKLPQIFIKEARIVRRSLIAEGKFTPRLKTALTPVVSGLAGETIPQLGGYVVTTAKPLAEVPLVRDTDEGQDPVLAHWQAGLGKTVAFTSGMWPRWGEAWTAWPRYGSTWAQLVRWASRQSEAAAFDVSTTVQGGKAKIRVDALDKNAEAINFMDVTGTLIAPGNQVEQLRLVQTGPGRYEGEYDARDAGSYVVNLAYSMGQGAQAHSGSIQTGLAVAYSPEYKELSANLALLEELRQRTGGQQVDSARPESLFDRMGLARAESRTSVWEDLMRLMLVLFLLDVAVRRIAINPIEIARKGRRLIAELGRGRRPAEESAAVLSTLKGARERLREEHAAAGTSEAGSAPDRSARYEAPKPDAKVTEELSEALGGASESDQPVVARPTRKAPRTTEADYTSRLLKAKRRAQEKRRAEDDQP